MSQFMKLDFILHALEHFRVRNDRVLEKLLKDHYGF